MTPVWKCSPLSMFIKMICFEGYNYYSLHSPTHMSAEMYVSTLSSIGNPEIFIQYWILIILSYVAPFHLLHISLNERPPLIGRIQSSPQSLQCSTIRNMDTVLFYSSPGGWRRHGRCAMTL